MKSRMLAALTAVASSCATAGTHVHIAANGRDAVFDVSPDYRTVTQAPDGRASWKPANATRQALALRVDAETLSSVWGAQFFDCRTSGPTNADAPKPRISLDDTTVISSLYFVSSANWLLISDLIGAKAAIVDLEHSMLVTPPCPAAVEFSAANPETGFVAIAAKDVKAIEYIGTNPENWSATFGEQSTLFVYRDDPLQTRPTRIKVEHRVLDVSLDENGQILVLQAQQHVNWFNPMNWILAIGAHQEVKSTVTLTRFDDNGMTGTTIDVMKCVGGAQANFVSLVDKTEKAEGQKRGRSRSE